MICVSTKAFYMDGNNIRKDDENGLLSCEIFIFPAAARLSFQRMGRRSLLRPIDKPPRMNKNSTYQQMWKLNFWQKIQ